MVPSSTKWLKARNTTFTQALGPAKSTSKCFRNLECFLSCNNQSPSTACHSDCCENFLTCFSVIASSKVPLKSILWDESKIVQMQIWPPWILWLHFCLLGPAGTPLQYFYLENPMDWGAWWAAVQGVAKSWTWLKRLSSSSSGAYKQWHPNDNEHTWHPDLGF